VPARNGCDHSSDGGGGTGGGELWGRNAGGDQRAFAELFERHAQAVWNHAYRLTGSWSAAEDLTSNTFVIAWRKRADITLVRDSALPWLCTVAGNVARTEHRGATRRSRLVRRLPQPRAGSDHADSVAEQLDGETRLREVIEAVRNCRARSIRSSSWAGSGTYRSAMRRSCSKSPRSPSAPTFAAPTFVACWRRNDRRTPSSRTAETAARGPRAGVLTEIAPGPARLGGARCGRGRAARRRWVVGSSSSLDRCFSAAQTAGKSDRLPSRSQWKPVSTDSQGDDVVPGFTAGGKPMFRERTATTVTLSNPMRNRPTRRARAQPCCSTPAQAWPPVSRTPSGWAWNCPCRTV
jgi:hypothetical protein